MHPANESMGEKDGFQHLLANNSFSMQLFSDKGEILSAPAHVPQYCRMLAATEAGAGICNKGCGARFESPNPEKIQFFFCPFGVSNASVGINIAEKGRILLIGGRFFTNYQHFKVFFDSCLNSGVPFDEMLESCATARFSSFSFVEESMTGLAEQISKTLIDMPSVLLQEPPNFAAFAADQSDPCAVSVPERIQYISQFIVSLQHAENLVSIGDILLREASATTTAQTASIFLLDPERKELVLTNATGLPQEVELGLRCPVDKGVMGLAYSALRPFVVNNISELPHIPTSGLPHYKSKAFVSIPLVPNGHPLGILNITNRETDSPFTADEIRWLDLLSHSASLLIEQKLLQQQLQKTEYLALTDTETLVGSRRFFNMRLKEEFYRSSRRNHALSLALVRLHRRNSDSDSSDYLSRNESLRSAAAKVVSVLRSFDMVMRYDDNTFALLLPETKRQDAERILARVQMNLHDLFSADTTEDDETQSVYLTFGLAEYPSDVSSLVDLKNIAEQTLADIPEPPADTEKNPDKGKALDDPTKYLEDCIP